jgi:hypothetical protein
MNHCQCARPSYRRRANPGSAGRTRTKTEQWRCTYEIIAIDLQGWQLVKNAPKHSIRRQWTITLTLSGEAETTISRDSRHKVEIARGECEERSSRQMSGNWMWMVSEGYHSRSRKSKRMEGRIRPRHSRFRSANAKARRLSCDSSLAQDAISGAKGTLQHGDGRGHG